MFSLPRPIGTAIPHPPLYALANFDPNDITGSIGAEPLGDPNAPLQFPTVNRKAKRDSLMSRARAPMPPMPPPCRSSRCRGAGRCAAQARIAAPLRSLFGLRIRHRARQRAARARSAVGNPDKPALCRRQRRRPVYFGAEPLAAEQEQITPWAPGEAPVVMASRATGDRDLKQSAVAPMGTGENTSGESIANKGEVTGVDQRPKSPAERLALTGKTLRQGREVSRQRDLFRSARTNRCAGRSRSRRW